MRSRTAHRVVDTFDIEADNQVPFPLLEGHGRLGVLMSSIHLT